MCGIGGIYKMGKVPIKSHQLVMMANNLEYRGNDATGIALMDVRGRIDVFKNNEPAWRFTASKRFDDWIAEHLSAETQIALVHTRRATKGTPHKNDNNHPMYMGPGGGAVVHNGMIGNDDSLFEQNRELTNFKRSCETDSDILRALFDHHLETRGMGFDKSLIKEMCLVTGVAAVAAIHPRHPGKLLLLRDSNPLIVGGTKDFLAFASDKKAIFCALKPWVKLHGLPMQVHMPGLSFLPMNNESGWIIGPKGFEMSEKFACNGTRRPGNTRYGVGCDYHDRQKRFATEVEKDAATSEVVKSPIRELTNQPPPIQNPTSRLPEPEARTLPRILTTTSIPPRFVICPKPECSRHVELSAQQITSFSLGMLACKECNTNLALALKATVAN